MIKIGNHATSLNIINYPFPDVGTMDAIDAELCRRLLANSRTPYSELATGLGMTAQAAHKRVEWMISKGTIRRFTARLGMRAAGGVFLVAYGQSREDDQEALMARLASMRTVRAAMLSSGNHLHLVGEARGLADLEAFSSSVRNVGLVSEPRVGIVASPVIAPPAAGSVRLKALDLRIVRALRDDARRSAAEVAEEVGSTAKTVSKSIERMVTERLVEMSMEWVPDQAGTIVAMVHVRLKEGTDLRTAYASLMGAAPANLIFAYPLGNMPDMLLAVLWADSMADMKSASDGLLRSGVASSASPYVIHEGRYFDTWRDDMLDELVRKKASLERPA